MAEPGVLTSTQRDRDRLVVLQKAQKKLITQRQATAPWCTDYDSVRRTVD